MTRTVLAAPEDLGHPASGQLAARAEAITKAYARGDAKVTALPARRAARIDVLRAIATHWRSHQWHRPCSCSSSRR